MNIHFIAIGGAIMHNLAICLKKSGHHISGSDDIIFDPSKSKLESYDLLPTSFGFFKENIHAKLDAIILGMHAKKDNIELLEAQKLGLKVYSFPEFIYEQSKNKKRVVIAGSHGKTTTTAMIMHVLKELKMDFDYMVGSSLAGFEDSVALTDAPLIILEGDEYLSSPIEMRSKFHYYKPDISLITGIAWDHINVFPTLELYHQTFEEYIANHYKNSSIVWFEQDNVLKKLCKKTPCKNESYNTPDFKIENGISILVFEGKEYPLEIFGTHNLQNLEGARKVCLELDIESHTFLKAISSFAGTARRLEKIKNIPKDLIAFKDFAHSPSKLEATVKAVGSQFKDKKLLACMELHTFSSTDPQFLKEFRNSMNPADIAIIYMSAKAFEIKAKKAIDDNTIRENFNNENILVYRNPEELKSFLGSKNLTEYTLLLMTSGNFDGINWQEFLNKAK